MIIQDTLIEFAREHGWEERRQIHKYVYPHFQKYSDVDDCMIRLIFGETKLFLDFIRMGNCEFMLNADYADPISLDYITDPDSFIQ